MNPYREARARAPEEPTPDFRSWDRKLLQPEGFPNRVLVLAILMVLGAPLILAWQCVESWRATRRRPPPA